MALDFPTSPTNGQIYDNYYWDNTNSVWRLLGDSLEIAANFSNTATGTYTSGFDYKYVSFTSSGTLTVTRGGYADVLVVGGGGGADNGGGGGGEVVSVNNLYIPSGNLTVTVGAGGLGTRPATAGSYSLFQGIVAFGGGLGGTNLSPGQFDAAGGGGGGAGSGFAGGVSVGRAFAGGAGAGNAAGGGGGFTAVGVNATSSNGGAGGAGTNSSITGSSVTYGAGGGGGGSSAGGAAGGTGAGAGNATGGNNGTNGTGGGGGGGWSVGTGGNGGSGIVIVRVRTN